MKNLLLIIGLSLIFSSIKSQTFSESAAALGIEHSFNARALMGGGAAFFDYENDGDQDVYITGGLNGDFIYRNEGNSFSKILDDIGLSITLQYNTTGVTTGDIDNDGDRDLFVTTWERYENGNEIIAKDLIFLNNGDGTFSEIGNDAGITKESFAIGACFLDYNKDGFLDIFVITHVDQPAFLYDDYGVIVGFDHDCYANLFYKNNGDNTFTEVSDELGLNQVGCGLAAMPTDYDFDGDLDIMIANDFGPFLTPNELYQNNYPNDNFTNVGSSTGADVAIYGMGIAAADYDHDQDLDYYITNLGANVLLENDNNNFTDVAAAADVENTLANGSDFSTGWGTAFMDVDNDTWDDLFVANGRIPSLPSLPTAFQDPNKLYLNNGDKTFTDITATANVGAEDYNRGMAYADFDNDGDLDFLVIALNEFGATSKFYINENNNGNHYVQFKLVGKESNRDGYGSKVWVYSEGNAFVKELYGGGASHVSQHSSIIHFGLGTATTIDSVRVEWTNGHIDHLGTMGIDQMHTIEEGFISSVKDITNTELENIKITPNPFSDHINIITTTQIARPVQVELLSTTGLSIFKNRLTLDTNTNIPIPTHLPKGVYVLKINDKNSSTSRKIIKMN